MGRLKYPIGVQNFEGLRNDNYVYIDKTRYIYELVNGTRKVFKIGVNFSSATRNIESWETSV